MEATEKAAIEAAKWEAKLDLIKLLTDNLELIQNPPDRQRLRSLYEGLADVFEHQNKKAIEVFVEQMRSKLQAECRGFPFRESVR